MSLSSPPSMFVRIKGGKREKRRKREKENEETEDTSSNPPQNTSVSENGILFFSIRCRTDAYTQNLNNSFYFLAFFSTINISQWVFRQSGKKHTNGSEISWWKATTKRGSEPRAEWPLVWNQLRERTCSAQPCLMPPTRAIPASLSLCYPCFPVSLLFLLPYSPAIHASPPTFPCLSVTLLHLPPYLPVTSASTSLPSLTFLSLNLPVISLCPYSHAFLTPCFHSHSLFFLPSRSAATKFTNHLTRLSIRFFCFYISPTTTL